MQVSSTQQQLVAKLRAETPGVKHHIHFNNAGKQFPISRSLCQLCRRSLPWSAADCLTRLQTQGKGGKQLILTQMHITGAALQTDKVIDAQISYLKAEGLHGGYCSILRTFNLVPMF